MKDHIVKVEGRRCMRCGYEWVPRPGREPKTCPSCRSAYWNEPRVRPKREPVERVPEGETVQ